jgi:chromate transporter
MRRTGNRILRELALLFLRLGTIGFGGPAAHIAMMEDEVVTRRAWMSHPQFLDLVGATHLIPGPNSTEMAIHIGYLKAGWKGLVVAGCCFILPAAVITLAFGYLYVKFGTMPELGFFMWGIRAAIIAIVAVAITRLGRPLAGKPFMVIICLIVAGLSLLRVDELVLLLAAAILGAVWSGRGHFRPGVSMLLSIAPLPMLCLIAFGVHSGEVKPPISLGELGLFFLKIGSILYGSGYVLLAFLQTGLVESRHLLTPAQLLDAVAIGQITPGPVLSTATFVGYLISGVPGAVVCTIAIFLPSFIFVFVTAPFIPKLRTSPVAGGFLDGVTAASLGLMLAVCVILAISTLTGVASWIMFGLAGIVLMRWSVHPVWIVAGSAALGWLCSLGGIH